jgi:hypothetical protein
MSEQLMVSRRGILALAGGGVLAATTISPPPAAAQSEDFVARIVATVPRTIFENVPLIVTARCQVPAFMVGERYILRVTMQTDTTDIRYKLETEPAPIPAAVFQRPIFNGDSHPIDDWNLIAERIHVMVASINIVHQAAFGIAPDYAFKVREV